MSEPQTINGYLAELNACLEVGLRSRRRISREVVDHLSQAMHNEREDGASATVAERRAIAAFGAPEEVAQSFESGTIGRLDKRLAVSTRRLSGWMGRHPWRAAVMKIALLTIVLALLAAVAAIFGAQAPLLGPSAILLVSVVWVLWFSSQAPLGRRLRARITARPWRGRRGPAEQRSAGARRPVQAPGGFFIAAFSYPTLTMWLAMDGDDAWSLPPLLMWTGLFGGVFFVVFLAAERSGEAVARRRSGESRKARSRWLADHPWTAALVEVWCFPCLFLAGVFFLDPGPLGLRAALTVWLAAATALLVVGRRLSRSREEKQTFAREYDRWAFSGAPS